VRRESRKGGGESPGRFNEGAVLEMSTLDYLGVGSTRHQTHTQTRTPNMGQSRKLAYPKISSPWRRAKSSGKTGGSHLKAK